MCRRMMVFHRLFVIACAVLLLVPSSAAADSIEIRLNTNNVNPDAVFGPVSFEATLDSLDLSCYPLSPCEDLAESLGDVLLQITSGPMLDVTIVNSDSTLYSYAGGTIGFEATWELPDGSLATGGWVAPLPAVTFRVYGEDEVDGGGNDYPKVEFSVGIGIGKFDPVLAHALGVRRKSRSADVFGFLENIAGEPPLEERIVGNIYEPTLTIRANTVPEPGTTVLALLGAVGLVTRHARSLRFGRRSS